MKLNINKKENKTMNELTINNTELIKKLEKAI